MTGCIETDVMTLRDQAADFERRLRKLEAPDPPADWRDAYKPGQEVLVEIDPGRWERGEVVGPEAEGWLWVRVPRRGPLSFPADGVRPVRPAPQPDEAARLQRALDVANGALEMSCETSRKLQKELVAMSASRDAWVERAAVEGTSAAKMRAVLDRVRTFAEVNRHSSSLCGSILAILKDGGV